MGCLILDFFQLILGVFFDFALDIIYKDNRFSRAFLGKSLKLFPTRRCGSIMFDLIFVLLPAKKDPIFEKGGCKRYALMAFCSSCLEIVFTLLTKVIALHVRISIVKVYFSYFEGSF